MAFSIKQAREEWNPAEGSRLDKMLRTVEEAHELVAEVGDQRSVISDRMKELNGQLAAVSWRDGVEGASRHAAALTEMVGLEMVLKAILDQQNALGSKESEGEREIVSIASVLRGKNAEVEKLRHRWGEGDKRTRSAVAKRDNAVANYLMAEGSAELESN